MNWKDELKKIIGKYKIPDDTKKFLANDIIDSVHSLLKQQIRQAKIEELKETSNVVPFNPTMIKNYLTKRISELEGETK